MITTAIERFNERITPLINTTTDEYKAIIGKTPFTPMANITQSSHFNCGAICNEIEYLIRFCDSISKVEVFEELVTPYLDYFIQFFTTLQRFDEETDEAFINRVYALMRRGSIGSWGTVHSIKEVFAYFYNRDDIYVLDNSVESGDNLIINGEFQDALGAEWSISGTRTVARDENVSFTGQAGLSITGSGTALISQTIAMLTGGNTIMFSHEGDVELSIVNGSGEYWNGEDWQVAEFLFTYDKDDLGLWKIGIEHFTLDSDQNVTFNFHVDGTEDTYIDRVRAGAKPDCPTVEVLVITEGQAGGFFSMAPGTSDPDGAIDYDVASYFDQMFLGGEGSGLNSTSLNQLLQIVKMGGVCGILTSETRG